MVPVKLLVGEWAAKEALCRRRSLLGEERAFETVDDKAVGFFGSKIFLRADLAHNRAR